MALCSPCRNKYHNYCIEKWDIRKVAGLKCRCDQCGGEPAPVGVKPRPAAPISGAATQEG